MRKLIVTENITLDGVIDASEGWFASSDADADQSDIVETIREHRKAADALLVGRRTFEELRGYWPQQTDDTTGIGEYLDRVAKFVFSTTLAEPDWRNTTVLSGPLAEEIAQLRDAPGADIVCTGSIKLVDALITAGVVDEYRLFVYPVVLGRGRRLFNNAIGVPALRLAEARPFRSGVVLLDYKAEA